MVNSKSPWPMLVAVLEFSINGTNYEVHQQVASMLAASADMVYGCSPACHEQHVQAAISFAFCSMKCYAHCQHAGCSCG